MNDIKEIKHVKHTFSREEKEEMSSKLVHEISNQTTLTLEAKQVQSSYKAKLDEVSSRVGSLATNLQAGFEMRPMECRVEFRAKEGKKDYYRTDTGALAHTEDMSQSDFQLSLDLEKKAEKERQKNENEKVQSADIGLTEIVVWDAPEDLSSAAIALKRDGEMWVASGQATIAEHTYQGGVKRFKERYPAIEWALKQLRKWLRETLGRDTAAGFDPHINRVAEEEEEKVE